jgi:hypothetical protein
MIFEFRSRGWAILTLAWFSAGAADFSRAAWTDIRMLGRGDAGLANIVGGASAFYNPAGLAASDTYSFTLINPIGGTNRNLIASYQNIIGLTQSTGQTLSEQFSPFLGQPMNLQANVFPHISVPHLMLGFYDMFDADVEYRDPVFPRLEVDLRNDWGLIAGAGFGYKDFARIGFSLRWINRNQIKEDIDSATLLSATADYLDEIKRKGNGFGFNIGTQGMVPLAKNSKLSVGFVVEDVANTTFRSADRTVPLPERQPMRMNAGLAWNLSLPMGTTTAYFDMKDLNRPEVDWSKKIYTGVEVGTRFADFRAGLFQGYWTVGTSFALLPFLLVDVASYGRELDSAAGLREDRYYIVGLRMGLDLRKGAKKKQRFTLDHL